MRAMPSPVPNPPAYKDISQNSPRLGWDPIIRLEG